MALFIMLIITIPAPFYGVEYYLLLTLSTAPTLVNDSRAYLIPGCVIVELPPTLIA